MNNYVHKIVSSALNLIIDKGNTRTKLALYEGTDLIHTGEFEKLSPQVLRGWLTNQKVENAILSTVSGPVSTETAAYLRAYFQFFQLEADTPVPIDNAYETPETLGKDRLAAVIGAWELFPEQASLVIDAGTCITYDLIDAKGVYQGGNISPGWNLRMKAMNHFTAALPLVQAKHSNALLGKTTHQALQAGGSWGILLEIEGFIQLCREAYGYINVILTGGDAVLLAEKLKNKIFVNHNLVLLGLNKILNYNVERLE